MNDFQEKGISKQNFVLKILLANWQHKKNHCNKLPNNYLKKFGHLLLAVKIIKFYN
jgi:hypothetical protein